MLQFTSNNGFVVVFDRKAFVVMHNLKLTLIIIHVFYHDKWHFLLTLSYKRFWNISTIVNLTLISYFFVCIKIMCVGSITCESHLDILSN